MAPGRHAPSRLREAIAAAQNGAPGELPLLVETGDRFETAKLRYAGGLGESQLERLSFATDRLGVSIAPRTR